MRSYFSRATCTQFNIRRGSRKMQCFDKLFQVLINLSEKLSQSSYFKAFYERSIVQFLSQRTLYMTFCQQNFTRNAALKFNCSRNWQNLSVRLSQSSCFKALRKNLSAAPFVLQSALYLTFYQQNIGKNTMLRNFFRGVNKSYQ